MLKQDDSIIQDEDIKVFVDSLADSSVILGLRAWVKTEEYWSTRWRLLEEIKLIFDEEGIEIPFNQLTVHMAENNKRILSKSNRKREAGKEKLSFYAKNVKTKKKQIKYGSFAGIRVY